MKSFKEARLTNVVTERENVGRQHEDLVRLIDLSEGGPSTEHLAQIDVLRTREIELDSEIVALTEDIERDRAAADRAKSARRIAAGGAAGVEVNGEEIAYADFYTYARDVVLTRQGRSFAQISAQFSREEREEAAERLNLLERVNNTLSSNVGGLQPAQHIDQIFQVINSSRPLVASASRTTLERGTLTYPKVTTRPVVAVQASEKTEAGNQGMVVDMQTATASTYLGGGDLSWQAINWSTPDALQLWFNLAAADYALKTEQDAGDVITDSGYGHIISTPIGSTDTFAEVLTGIAAGAAKVYATSGRQADTLYAAEDRFWYLFGLTSDAFAQFATVNVDGIGPLKIVRTRGMDSGEMIVGDSSALLVAETAGAPVELRAVEPAIGGLEVGIIGAFEAVVVDDGAFALVTTAS